MNINDFRLWDAFTVQDGRVLLAAPDVWRLPEEWQREAKCGSCGGAGEYSFPEATSVDRQSDGVCDACDGLGHDVVNVLLPDLFAEYGGVIRHGKFVSDPRHTVSDVLRDIFATIDKCPLLTFWCPTRHPERVRERWPQFVPSRECPNEYRQFTNVRLGLYEDAVKHERDMDLRGAYTPDGSPHGPHGKATVTLSRIPYLESLADLCGGCFILHRDGSLTMDLKAAVGE